MKLSGGDEYLHLVLNHRGNYRENAQRGGCVQGVKDRARRREGRVGEDRSCSSRVCCCSLVGDWGEGRGRGNVPYLEEGLKCGGRGALRNTAKGGARRSWGVQERIRESDIGTKRGGDEWVMIRRFHKGRSL